MVELDFRRGEPIYAQIVDQLGSRIAAGELKPGDQLPTVRELAEELEVNFNTVARAYRVLDEAGVVSTQQGRGTYVLKASQGSAETLEGLTRSFARRAHRLGFQPEEVAKVVGFVLEQWDQEGRPSGG